MKIFKSFFLIFWISLLGFCHAKVEDYLKGIEFKRSFSPIEGKVIDVNIAMSEKDYNEIIEKFQLSVQEYNAVYHASIPEELKYTVKGNKFFGRNNLRLRADLYDVTHIRSKLVIDLLNKWNIPTVQETYANLYINNKYFGFYMFLDDIKPGWIHDVYQIPEEEDIKTLYSCNSQTFRFDPEIVRKVCQNEKDEYLNYTQPFYDMVDEIYGYTTLEQLQRKVDNVENIRKVMIMEYLFSAVDNFILGANNYNFYQKPNGKWEFIPMDFNLMFLVNFKRLITTIPFPIERHDDFMDYLKVKFEEWHSEGTRKPFIDILYYNDREGFIKTLKELLITGFNPDEINARIDELVEFVAPYIVKDITPDKEGKLPGRINLRGVPVQYTPEESRRNANYDDDNDGNIGLKKFVQVKFDTVCELYGLNKKEILLRGRLYREKRAIESKINEFLQVFNEFKAFIQEIIYKLLNKFISN
eukprot:jgi/Orpsp1_1/1190358/evm.model.d7180000078514.1